MNKAELIIYLMDEYKAALQDFEAAKASREGTVGR